MASLIEYERRIVMLGAIKWFVENGYVWEGEVILPNSRKRVDFVVRKQTSNDMVLAECKIGRKGNVGVSAAIRQIDRYAELFGEPCSKMLVYPTGTVSERLKGVIKSHSIELIELSGLQSFDEFAASLQEETIVRT